MKDSHLKSSSEMFEVIDNNKDIIKRLEDTGHECSFLHDQLNRMIRNAECMRLMESSELKH